MKLNPLTCKFWLAMAVTAASLGLASTASATTPVDPGSGSATTTVTTDAPKVYIPAARVPKFSAGSQLKASVKGG